SINRVGRNRIGIDGLAADRGRFGEVLPLFQLDLRSLVALRNLLVLEEAGDTAGGARSGRGAAVIIGPVDQAGGVGKILITAGLIVQQVPVNITVAGKRRRLGAEQNAIRRVVIVVPFPVTAARCVMIDAQHHFALVYTLF